MKIRFIIVSLFVLFAIAPAAFACTKNTDCPGTLDACVNSVCTTCSVSSDGTCSTNCSTNIDGVCAPTPTQSLSNSPAPTQTLPNGNSNVRLVNPLGTGTDLNSLIGSILDFVIYLGSFIVILMLVFVGFKFVIARGSPAEITKARDMLMWTVIGALILLGAKAISLGIQATVKALGS